MGKNRSRIILVSSLTAMCAVALTVAGTYAIWNQTSTFNNHISAGNLKLTLKRNSYTKHLLDNETGLMKDVTDSTETTITDNDNVFGLGSGELMAPTAYYETNLTLVNEGSVAFTYSIYFNVSDGSDETLAEQLYVSYKIGENATYGEAKQLSTYMGDTASTTALISSENSVQKGQSSEKISIKVSFDDQDNNNDAMDKSVDFDIKIVATQDTSTHNN